MLQREHFAILSTFIKVPFVIKIFVLSIFEWPLKTGFTVPFSDYRTFQLHKPFITMHLQAEIKSVFPERLAAVLDLHCV